MREIIPAGARVIVGTDASGNPQWRYPDRSYGDAIAQLATEKRQLRTGDDWTQIVMKDDPGRPGRMMYTKAPVADLSMHSTQPALPKPSLLPPPAQGLGGVRQSAFPSLSSGFGSTWHGSSGLSGMRGPGLTRTPNFATSLGSSARGVGSFKSEPPMTMMAPGNDFSSLFSMGPASKASSAQLTPASQHALLQKFSSLGQAATSAYPDPWNSQQRISSGSGFNPTGTMPAHGSGPWEGLFPTPTGSERHSTEAPSAAAFSYDRAPSMTSSLKRPRSSGGSSVNTADSGFLREEAGKDIRNRENIRDILRKVSHWRSKKKVQDSASQRRSPSLEAFDFSDVGLLNQLAERFLSEDIPENKRDYSTAKSYKRVARRIGNILKRG